MSKVPLYRKLWGRGSALNPKPQIPAGLNDDGRFRGGLVFKAHRLCVSLSSRLESNKEKKGDVEEAHAQLESTFATSFFSSTLLSSLELSDIKVYEP